MFKEIASLRVSNFNEECVKSRLLDFYLVSNISEENLSTEEVKALNNNLVKNENFVIKRQTKVMKQLFSTEVVIFQS